MPIDAILFGGRRPKGVPLVYEAFDWKHAVFIGAAMKSEATAAAEHKGKVIMHDPFAMRPFFGYNFGHYLQHWLSMETAAPNVKLPKVFHVNWFRKDDQVRGFSISTREREGDGGGVGSRTEETISVAFKTNRTAFRRAITCGPDTGKTVASWSGFCAGLTTSPARPYPRP